MCVRFLRSWDLRFANKNDEASFKASLELQLLWGASICGVFYMLAIGYSLWMGYGGREIIRREALEPDNPLFVGLASRFFGMFMCMAFGAYAAFRYRQLRIGKGRGGGNSEYLVTLWAVCVIISWLLRSIWHVSRMYGLDPEQALDSNDLSLDPEMLLLVRTDIIVTSVCLFSPIRCAILWIVPVAALVVFVIAASLGGRGEGGSLGNGVNLFILCFLSFWGAHRQERQVREKWHAQNQVQVQQVHLRTQEQALCQMLNRFCDCLIQLSPDLIVLEHDERFSALLLKGTQKLHGHSFSEYLASDLDKDHMRAAISRNSENEDYSDVVPLRVRDSHGTEFQIHAYLTSFHTSSGNARYLVGLAEAQERMREAKESVDELRTSPCDSQAAPKVDRPESSCTSTESELGLPLESSLEEISVTFDDIEFDIVSCSTGYTALCGPLPRTASMLDMIAERKGPNGFVAAMQGLGNQFRSVQDKSLLIQPAAAKSAGIAYKANCTLDQVSWVRCKDHTDQGVDGSATFRIILDDVRQIRCKQKKEKRQSLMRPLVPKAHEAPHMATQL